MAIRIDLSVNDANVQKAFDRLDQRMAQTAANAGSLRSSLAGSVRGAAGGGGSAPGKIKSPPVVRPLAIVRAMGPQAALQQYGPAALQGDPFAASIVNSANSQMTAVKRAQKSLAPPVDPVFAAMQRTRFAKQGSKIVGMPLGRDMGLLHSMMGSFSDVMPGMAGMAGNIAGLGAAAPFAAATAGIGIFVAALKAGADAISTTRRNWMRLGGTPAQAEAAARLERFTGASASGLMSNISGGGLPAALASQMGVRPIRGFFGANDDARDFIKILDGIRRIARARGMNEARRYAIGFGEPQLASVGLLSDSTYNAIKRSRQLGNTDFSQRSGAEFDANIGIMRDSLERLAKVAATPALRLAALNMGMVSEVFDKMSQVTGANALVQILDRLEGLMNPKKGKDSNTDALNRNTDAINNLANGIYGNSKRAPGAIPRGSFGTDKADEHIRQLRSRNNLGLA